MELVQVIFHTAAKQEKSTALNLVRVCKAARLWVIPIIYETVILDNPSAVRFESMLRMPSSDGLVSFVKYLRASCLPNVDILSRRCSKITAMALANYDVHHLNRLELPSLTHLTISGFLSYSHFTSNMSIFATITHLRFTNDVPRLPDDFATAMPNLTHFACCYCLSKVSQHRELELDKCLRIVLAAPEIRVALVYLKNQTSRLAEDSVADIGAAHDPKVVIALAEELPGEWQNPSPTYDPLWTFAETKLAVRLARELEARPD